MDKFQAIPLKSVGQICFGMTRGEVRKIFSIEAKEFKKTKFSRNTSDDFGFCHVFYNLNNECEAIEIFDEIQISINDNIIFPGDIDNAKKVINDFEEDFGSYISKTNSIGIYAPTGKIESILLGNENYYK